MDRRAGKRAHSTDRRGPTRVSYSRGLAVSLDGKLKVECRIEDFSRTGAKLTVSDGAVLAERIYVLAAGQEQAFEALIKWATARQYGVQFVRTFPLINV